MKIIYKDTVIEQDFEPFVEGFHPIKISEKDFLEKLSIDEKQSIETYNTNISIREKQLADDILAKNYLVNITTKGKKLLATIHDSKTTAEDIEYDEDRGDKFFETLEEAQKYADTFNL